MKFKLRKKLLVLTALALGCISVSALAKTSSSTKTFEYAYSVNNIQYSGIYTGETANGLPSGKGEFQADTDSPILFSYSGEFENGLFEGTGICTYSDGSYLECTFSSGIPQEKGFISHPDHSYTTIQFSSSGIPYGPTDTYSQKNELIEHDFYNNGELITTLMQNAQQIDYRKLYQKPDDHYGSILKLSGTILHVYENDTSCIFKIKDTNENVYWGRYYNTSYNKYNQAIMPTLQEGDHLTLYAFSKGLTEYTCFDDPESNNIILPEISAITAQLEGETLDYNALSYDYENVLRFPYHYYKKTATITGQIQNLVKIKSKTYIQISDTQNNTYYISPKKSKESKSLTPGDFISVTGYYQGLFKEFDSVSGESAQLHLLFKGTETITILNQKNSELPLVIFFDSFP